MLCLSAPLTLLLALLALVPSLYAQETAESPDLSDDGPPITLGGLVQTQFNTTSVAGEQATNLALRRVRLAANAELNDFVSGRIQAELANAAAGGSAELNEAYALFTFAPAFQILAGKGGRPFGIVDATAAARLVPIERGARFRGARTVEQYRLAEELAYAGRSVGMQALGEVPGLPVGLAYAAGYFSGSTGEEGTDADIQQVAGRIQAQLLPCFLIGVAATNRAFSRTEPVGMGSEPTGTAPAGDTRRGSGYALDFEVGHYGEAGPHLLGEVMTGTVDPFRDYGFWSAQGWAAYRFGGLESATGGLLAAVEPMARVSWAQVDGPLGQFDGTLVTPGLNVYAAQNTRLALNLDLFFPARGGDALTSFKAQVQLAF